MATVPAGVTEQTLQADGKDAGLGHLRRLVHVAFLWFLWPFLFGRLLDLCVTYLIPGAGSAAVIGYLLGASINVAVAYWLLYLAGKGSPLARNAYCVLWGAWGAIMFVLGVIAVAALPTLPLAVDLVGVTVTALGIAQSIRILTRTRPVVHRARALGSVTTVSMRTEMPSFVATLLLLGLTVLEVGRDLLRAP